MTVAWPPSLTIETESVLKLFTGENFYSADAAIREVIFNSIDAIGRRMEAEPDTDADIKVAFDRDNQTIKISDNGDGMSRDDLANLFAKIGASASRFVKGAQQISAG